MIDQPQLELIASVNSVIGVLSVAAVAWRLSRRHGDEWEDVGGSLLAVFRLPKAWTFLKFVFGSRHVSLHDAVLSTFIWLLRAAFVFGTLLMVIALVLSQRGAAA